MSSVKKILPTLLLILLVYVWFFVFNQPPKVTEKQISGANQNITLFVEPNSGNSPIVNAINNAQKEILVEVYLLSDKSVIESLENAKSRGVAVNVILEEHPFGGGNLNPKTKVDLESHGIKVEWSSPDFALTHEKSIVIDEKIAFILSQNLTASAFSKNREFNIIDTNLPDVIEIRNIFLDDWQRKSFTPSDNLALIESPNNSRPVLVNLIKSARNEIDIEVEDIEDREILSLLEDKAKSLNVKLILPTLKQISGNKKSMDELISNKVEVKTMASPYVHGKTILVDNKTAFVGSINLSSQSLNENRELGIILSDVNSIQLLNLTFISDWNNAKIYP